MSLLWHLNEKIPEETKKLGQLIFAENKLESAGIGPLAEEAAWALPLNRARPLPFLFSIRFLRGQKPTESDVCALFRHVDQHLVIMEGKDLWTTAYS